MRSTLWMVSVGLALAFGLMLGGCAPWATYPPIEGATNVGDPLFPPMPGLMAEAVWYAHENYGEGEPIALNLPENTSPAVYDRVLQRIEAHPAAPGEPAYNVTSVRVRASEAEVDLIHPHGQLGGPELVTIAFKHVVPDGFEIQRARRWRFAVDEPQAHFIPWDEWRAEGTKPVIHPTPMMDAQERAEVSPEYTD